MREKVSVINVVKYAGAYIAFEIGSGFATGQEILQFYTSYGMYSIGAAVVSMALFAWAGGAVMKIGYETGSAKGLKPYRLICGKAIGCCYEYFVLIYMFAMLAVMISGAGAALNEYYGVDYYVGGLFMALIVFAAFAFGLNRLIDIVGLMGPLIIAFSIFVALCAIVPEMGNLSAADHDVSWLAATKPAKSWQMSGILYVAYNVVGSIAFLMALGRNANSAKEAAIGGISGGVMLIVTVIFMNFALLTNLDEIKGCAVPALKLAQAISPAAGAIFVVIMICGIFSTAAPILWTICNQLSDPGSRASLIIALLVSLDALILGQLPFDQLVGSIYPYTGYLGILLLICILIYQHNHRTRRVYRKRSDTNDEN